MLITTIIGYFYIGKITNNLLCAKLIGILIAIVFIVTFFYTYTTILGTNFDILNIGSFFVAVILGEYIAYKISISNCICNKNIAITILIILLISFIIFTYKTPRNFLFKDPITGTYGLNTNK